ncbi:4-hydroxybutyrate CoA-transferase [Aerococcaceae bacterium INB8]|uniref:4-hydroxybutyrate CoA-transferase n=1 Tax=Ruoffia halotolerans TaxID=2748684 RepID=A0A839A309_9LACT|nr:acetyl-CoA hydrolase/transferase C-terminal domain-containing protein [Ruoffia halotolerans]MBA5728387.1 4-hydroxybutyrate CoA-transferase [Ruoffia halotolerans]
MSNVKELYNQRLISMEKAAEIVQSGDNIVANPVVGYPSELSDAITDRYQELEDVSIYSLFALKPYPFLTDEKVAEKINYETMFMGPFERKLYGNGLFRVNSVNFSDLSSYIKNTVKPDIFIAQTSPMDEDGFMNLGMLGVAYGREAIDVAEKVIIQVNKEVQPVNKNLPKEMGSDHLIHISEVDYIVEADAPVLTIPAAQPTEIEEQIANHIVPLIKENSILQVGYGGLTNAVSYGLIGKVTGLGAHTEMITESIMELQKQGVITREIVGGFSLGTQDLYDWTTATDSVHIKPLSLVNKASVISEYDNFVSINATLAVDLTGQIASEAIGTRQVSSTGGAGDFVRGATHSKGGQSFVCLPSSYVNKKTGERESNIKFSLKSATPVTVPRQDIMNIVTEYGVADLWCQSIPERAKRLIEIAHPDFREELTQQAREAGYIN